MKKVAIIACVMLFTSPAFAQSVPQVPFEITAYKTLLSETTDRLVAAAAANQHLQQEVDRLRKLNKDLEAKLPKAETPK